MMLSVEEARTAILAGVEAVDPVEVDLEDAYGLVAAEDIFARDRLPRFDNSAMDGFAIRSADARNARPDEPVQLSVTGEVRAGAGGSPAIREGDAIRIATGAALPPEADAIVPIEDVVEAGTVIRLTKPVQEGAHIRAAAEDVEVGDKAIPAEMRLGPGELALLAALGHGRVPVRNRPKVAILVTGDELVPPTGQAERGQIYDSNSTAVWALAREAGAEVILREHVADTAAATTAALEQASGCADLIVSCGGVSVGPYDLVKEALRGLGTVEHWRVAMQPGKPVVIGKVRGVPFLGLPGNPVSVHVTFEQFARPAIKKMSGETALLRPSVVARLTRPVRGAAGRRRFIRVQLSHDEEGTWIATPTGPQGSHIQSSLVDCDGLAIVPEDRAGADPGEMVEVEIWRFPTT